MAATTAEELRVIELLCARLCHDLVSPIGAVGNGLEMLVELGAAPTGADDDFAVEAMKLAEQSAKRAADLLKLYRIAYGTAATALENGFGEVASLVQAYAEPRRFTVEWRPGTLDFDPHLHLGHAWGGVLGDEDIAVVRRLAKLVTNAFLLAELFLGRGGRISIRTEASGRLIVEADGPGARLDETLRRAIERDEGALDPITVQGRLTAMLAEALGLAVGLTDAADDHVGMTFAPPAPIS